PCARGPKAETQAAANLASGCCAAPTAEAADAVVPSVLLAANTGNSALRAVAQADEEGQGGESDNSDVMEAAEIATEAVEEAGSAVEEAQDEVSDAVEEADEMSTEALRQAQQALQEREADLEDLAEQLEERASALEELQGTLQQTRAELDDRRTQLDQAQEQLQSARAELDREREAFLQERRQREQQRRSTEQARSQRLSNPDELVAELRNLVLSGDSVERIRADITRRADEFLRAIETRGRVSRMVKEAEAKFREELLKGLELDSLNVNFDRQLRNTFEPAELLELLDFYQSETGSQLLENGDSGLAFDTAFIEREAETLFSQFVDEIDNLTSRDALDTAIQENLELISRAADNYFAAKGGETVRVGQLIAEGFLGPLQPLDGETYSQLTIAESGGVLRVEASGGRRIFFRY
ncbi:MAG: hypothetical protein ACFB21_09460, partial [Opitutales bacterium]